MVDAPDATGREAILKIHAKGKPFADGVDFNVIAKRTPGFTGADLANALNESALLAARRNHTQILMQDIEDAIDRVMAGPERKSRVMDEQERLVIAYHEAGHAIIGETLEKCDPVHKVTILPRGMSLGSTWSLPEKDLHLSTKMELEEDIAMSLGGRVAEEIRFGDVTTGAYGDLQRVTSIARAMVTEYGMSEKLGTLALGNRSRNPFLGRSVQEDRNYSEDVARQIDEEVRAIVDTAYARAHQILTEHRDKMERVVSALIEHETLDREQFLAVMRGESLPPRTPPAGGDGEVAATPENEVRESDAPNPTGNTPRLEPGTA